MSWTTNTYPVKELSTGEVLSIKTYTLKGGPGPHVHVQASVHGAEIQGNAVILKLMEALKGQKIKGSLTLVPLANPYATLNKHGTYTYGRYNPVTGHNWNRNYINILEVSDFDLEAFCKKRIEAPWEQIKAEYKSVLSKLFKEHLQKLRESDELQDNNKVNILLQELSLEADGILDLHTGPTATRYLYCADYEKELAKNMLFKYVLLIPNSFAGAMDEASFIPWTKLMEAFKALGRLIIPDVESFTMEFGSEETFHMDEGGRDVESILNYLKLKGMIEGEPKEAPEVHYCDLENYKTIYAPRGGMVDYHFAPGDFFKEGDALATFYSMKDIDPKKPIESCSTELRAKSDGIVINRCPSSNVHQGMELFQIMTRTFQ